MLAQLHREQIHKNEVINERKKLFIHVNKDIDIDNTVIREKNP